MMSCWIIPVVDKIISEAKTDFSQVVGIKVSLPSHSWVHFFINPKFQTLWHFVNCYTTQLDTDPMILNCWIESGRKKKMCWQDGSVWVSKIMVVVIWLAGFEQPLIHTIPFSGPLPCYWNAPCIQGRAFGKPTLSFSTLWFDESFL